MQKIYNTVIRTAHKLIGCVGIKDESTKNRLLSPKLKLFVDGQKTVFERLQNSILLAKGNKRVIWVHAASLGEYGIARPIIKKLRKDYDCIVVLTFFSSTGIEALKTKTADSTGSDIISYLPLDTPDNVSHFLDIVNPSKAIFIKSEIWPNYLSELRRRAIPTYLTSALINEKSSYTKWYGGLFRKALMTFSYIYTQDAKSVNILESLGYHNAINMGDTLYDNAVDISRMAYSNRIIENFCRTSPEGVFIAGSIDMKKDLEMVSYVANIHKDRKFIFVPHEISDDILNTISQSLKMGSVRYSDCTENTDFQGVQTLIIDYVGELSRIYRYGRLAYVGGGFTPLLHSVIEPSVYGLPVSFGPCIHRKSAPQMMMDHGVGEIVRNGKELDAWFTKHKDNIKLLDTIKEKALELAMSSVGSTERIVKSIMEKEG